MTDDQKKPRVFRIIDKASDKDTQGQISLSIDVASDDGLDTGDIEIDHKNFESVSDEEIYDPEMAGYDPRLAPDFDEEDEKAHLEFLIDCAIEWLPETQQVEMLLDQGIGLEYTVLYSAKVAVEEMSDSLDERQLDDMIAAMLLFGEEDESNKRDYYDLLSPEAQVLAANMQEAMSAISHEHLYDTARMARLMMLMGMIADIEVLTELRNDDGEEPSFEDVVHIATMMETLTMHADLPPRLLARAQSSLNALSTAAELPLFLENDGNCLVMSETPPIVAHTPRKPPRP